MATPFGSLGRPAATRYDASPATPSETRAAAPVVRYTLASTRLVLAFIFLWAFLDKLLGLGYATPAARAWVNGGSPTAGFLKSTDGPAAGVFQAMAGNAFVDTLFMMGLLLIGLALLAGIGLRVAAASGALLMLLMWAAVMPVATNPLVDDHIVYALVLVALAAASAGDTWGLGRQWARVPLVQRYPILR
ncbi:MAG TPA: hypothetical protein VNZ52_16145 [Candidatus Thermoplasmatota archaeon]|nr:hypothetical protein [Candidatus Thermoplasmatota archaeon]